MKKKHLTAFRLGFISLAITIIGICFYSCQNSVDEPQTQIERQETLAFQQLQQDLESYTDEFLASHPQSDSRGFFDFFKRAWDKIVTVVQADFSIDLGTHHDFGIRIGWDRAASCKAMSLNNDSNIVIIRDIIEHVDFARQLKIDSLYNAYSKEPSIDNRKNINYGKIHNLLILNRIKTNQFYDESYDSFIETDAPLLKKHGIESGNLSTDDYKTFQNYLNSFESIYSTDINTFYNNINRSSPDRINLTEVLRTYTLGIKELSSLEEIDEYSAQTITLVLNSHLSLSSKEQLLKAICIAIYSSHLWMDLVMISQ